jgi:hypothetical protein
MPPQSRKQPAATKPKKYFSFASAARASSDGSSSWKAGRRRSNKKSKGTFALVAAEYQKGDKAKQRTGNIYMRGKPRYGHNEAYKNALGKHTLAEAIRWNNEHVAYTVKVYTAKQARKLLKAARELDGGEEDLPEDIDETVFEGANAAAIDVVPLKVDDDDMIGVTGTTYPWKDELKERGFKYTQEVNGEEGLAMWLAAKDTVDMDDLTGAFQEYGFAVDVWDGVEGDDA